MYVCTPSPSPPSLPPYHSTPPTPQHTQHLPPLLSLSPSTIITQRHQSPAFFANAHFLPYRTLPSLVNCTSFNPPYMAVVRILALYTSPPTPSFTHVPHYPSSSACCPSPTGPSGHSSPIVTLPVAIITSPPSAAHSCSANHFTFSPGPSTSLWGLLHWPPSGPLL